MTDPAAPVRLTIGRADAEWLRRCSTMALSFGPGAAANEDRVHRIRRAVDASLAAAPEPPADDGEIRLADRDPDVVCKARATVIDDPQPFAWPEPPADDLAALIAECMTDNLNVSIWPGDDGGSVAAVRTRTYPLLRPTTFRGYGETPAQAIRAAMDAARQATGDDGRDAG